MATQFDAAKLDALLEQIQTVIDDTERQALFQYVGEKVGAKAEEAASVYAPSPGGRPLALYYMLNGKPSKFKSAKQRGYFFAALRQGKIKLPFRRDGTLGRSITSKVTATPTSAQILVGTTDNVSSYAKYVIGDEEQSEYHKQTGWKPISEDIKHDSVALLQEAQDATNKYMADHLPRII